MALLRTEPREEGVGARSSRLFAGLVEPLVEVIPLTTLGPSRRHPVLTA